MEKAHVFDYIKRGGKIYEKERTFYNTIGSYDTESFNEVTEYDLLDYFSKGSYPEEEITCIQDLEVIDFHYSADLSDRVITCRYTKIEYRLIDEDEQESYKDDYKQERAEYQQRVIEERETE